MNRSFLLLIPLMLLTPLAGYAQGRRLFVRDAVSKTAIPYAHIHDKDGHYLSSSDSLGIAVLPSGAKPSQVSHIAYESQTIQNDTIDMLERNFPIDVVPVVAKMPAYVRLRTWVRVYQYIDSLPVNYVEGLVDFYTPTTKNKLSYQVQALALYRDSEAIRQGQLSQGGWDINSNGLIDWLLNPHISGQASSDFCLTDTSEGIILMQGKKPYPQARISSEGKHHAVSVDLLADEQGRKLKLFGRSVRIVHKELFQLFPKRETDLIKAYDMQAYRWFTALEVEYKNRVLPIRNITELYVLDRQFMSNEEFRAIKTQRDWGNLSHSEHPEALADYTAKYVHQIPERLDGITARLGKSLHLLPSK